MQHSVCRILLIEDDLSIRDMLVMVLEVEGYIVDAVHDAEAVLAMVERGDDPPDMVLTDLQLPAMPGDELVRTLQRYDTWRGVPIVLLTASLRGQEAAKAAGVAAYIPKPFLPPELTEVVSKVCCSGTSCIDD